MTEERENINRNAAIMNAPEAAEFLRISESTIRRLVKEKRVPYFRINSRCLFSRRALEQWTFSLIEKPSGQPASQEVEIEASRIWDKTQRS